MKKLLALTLALCMLLCFTACGDDDEKKSGSVNSGNLLSPDTPPIVTPDISQTSTGIVGSLSGNSYTNSYFGFCATIPSPWIVSTFEQASLQVLGTSLDAAGLEQYLLTNGLTCSLLATYNNASVNVIIEDVAGKGVSSAQDYANASIQLLPNSLKAIGYTDVSADVTQIQFAGATRTAIALIGSSSTGTLYQTAVCIHSGNYVAVITFSARDEATLGELMGYFSAC